MNNKLDFQVTFAEENSEKYNKYKAGMKKFLIFKILFCILTIISIIFILFTPIFSINLTKLSEEDLSYALTLPDTEDAFYVYYLNVLSGENVSDCVFRYSLFDEIMCSFNIIIKERSSIKFCEYFGYSICFISLMVGLVLIVSAAAAVVTAVLSINSYLNFEEYSKKYYETLKSDYLELSSTHRRTWSFGRLEKISPTSELGFALFIEIVVIIMAKNMNSLAIFNNETIATAYTSYLTGITVFMVFAILFVVATFVIKYYSKSINVQAVKDVINEEVEVELKD